MNQDFCYSEEFYQSVDNRASETAKVIFRELRNYINVTSMVDAGCGSGAWVRTAIDEGLTQTFGVDLSSSLNLIRRNKSFEKMLANGSLILNERDFVEDSKSNLPVADLAICLEVAEHLPPKIAASLVARLTEASRFVIFSAAQPGQGGTYHINERPIEYWVEEFAKYNFEPFDPFREILRNTQSVPRFYALNMLLFVSKGSINNDKRVVSKSSLDNVRVDRKDQLDKRTLIEKVRYAFIKKLPVKVVTALSKRLKY
jgi:SAM-dependent methyltransferase